VAVNRGSSGGDAATDRYRRLIEQSGIGLFQTNVDGSIDWLNAAAARALGYDSPQEFLQSIRDIHEIYVDPSRREDLLALLERDGAVTNFEYEAKRRDGGSRWISITARALHEGGRLEGFEGTFLDVTDKKLLEAATRSISSDLEPAAAVAHFAEVLRRAVPFTQLSLVVIEGDRYRRVVSLSGHGDVEPLPAGEWVPLEGNSVELVVRSGAPAVVDDTAEARWPFDLVLHQAGVRSYAIFPLVDQDGVFATFNLGRAEKGGFDADVFSLVEILVSAATQAVKNILLFEQQREAVARLEELNRMKHEFLAGIAHDLRNPAAVIGGAVQLLESSWETMPDEKKREVLRTIRRSVSSLQTSLQRDLDLTLLEQGELGYDIRPFDLPAVLHEVVSSWSSSATSRSFDFRVTEGLPAALGDPHRQGQILHNLLSNAVKFSPTDSTITVEATATPSEIVVSVLNEGAIDPGDHLRLFQRMSRLSSDKPGTGLGLYICRLMVEAQGGRIWFDDGISGVRFSYTVPIAGRGAG
jgi:PAS domain S-box-containing protein